MDIVDVLKLRISANMVIPKPAAKADFTIKGWGKRRQEEALVYRIPNHKNAGKPYEKGITVSELRQAYERISRGEDFTREWFNENMPNCASEGGCNFTTIGGIFEYLDLASYRGRGLYRPKHSSYRE